VAVLVVLVELIPAVIREMAETAVRDILVAVEE